MSGLSTRATYRPVSPVRGSSEWTFAGLPAAQHQRLPRPGLRDRIALRLLARRILELIRGDVFFWQSLQAAAILVAVPIPFVVNLFLDRYISGFTMGAVKG
jgi:hypothetical protein